MGTDGQLNWCNSQPFEWIDVGFETAGQLYWKESKPVETVFVAQAPPVEGTDDILYNTL